MFDWFKCKRKHCGEYSPCYFKEEKEFVLIRYNRPGTEAPQFIRVSVHDFRPDWMRSDSDWMTIGKYVLRVSWIQDMVLETESEWVRR